MQLHLLGNSHFELLTTVTCCHCQVYRCMLKNGDEVKVDNPTELPDEGARDHILEPYVKCEAAMLLP